MTNETLSSATRECPYCQGTIPKTAKFCSCCSREVNTARTFVLDTNERPFPSTTDTSTGNPTVLDSNDPASRSLGQLVPPKRAPVIMKTCMYCGVDMPDMMLLCPVCRKLQNSAQQPRENARKSNRGRRVFMFLIGLVLLGTIAACVCFVFQDELHIQEVVRHATSRLTGRSLSEQSHNAGGKVSAQEQQAGDQEESAARPTKVTTVASQPAGTDGYDDGIPVSNHQATDQQKSPTDAKQSTIMPSLPRTTRAELHPNATSATIKAICKFCAGEGHYMMTPKDRQRCPACMGVGYRMVSIPPDRQICPDCQGIGRIEERPHVTETRTYYVPSRRAYRCDRCKGLGSVKVATPKRP
jgi:hypothetical protein